MAIAQQGDIIMLDLNPIVGHEQSGYRPAVVISNDFAISHSPLALVCSITRTRRDTPLVVSLDERTATTGYVLCEQTRAVDLRRRSFKFVERVPEDILCEIVDIVTGMVEIHD
jgi:mRNA interferase MazF